MITLLLPTCSMYSVTGHAVKWCKWKLHVGFNAREGLVLRQAFELLNCLLLNMCVRSAFNQGLESVSCS
jgi:hypothetical protein